MAASRTERSIVPCQQIKIKTPKKNGGGAFISSPSSENSGVYGVILHPHSHPLSSSVGSHHCRQNQQPPLLPLPISALQQPLISRSVSQGFSCPPPPTRRNRIRDASLTPKISKQAKREEVKRDLKSASRSISELLHVHQSNRLGPDPAYLPRYLPIVLTTASGEGKFETFPGSVFSLSPPPSSLPLPKFSLRQKLSCNAGAAGVDAGATDDLRRLLRLR
ncbi:uncharacterized protein LOC114724150 [Neltuma alba]|uniref:uncharacterized protein LOC114724150 n=1 Tax=Neltuma alba TaxID=207710 RepID=UPI0010A41469|nr:uncharacterized protein LOC114724150 [Prosopis alba]XP_028766300.1 uncharacterized protein LOC114724150 [Prosopis alba]